jgi:hypothetical protein
MILSRGQDLVLPSWRKMPGPFHATKSDDFRRATASQLHFRMPCRMMHSLARVVIIHGLAAAKPGLSSEIMPRAMPLGIDFLR